MKILIIGRGIIGTVYGWALSDAGNEVTHVVRREDLPTTVALDLLDFRPGRRRHAKATYRPRTVTSLSPANRFDVAIVATKHYQAVDALRQYLPLLPGATILMFTANWEGCE